MPRADIVDREGRVLAQSVPVWTCFADKKMIPRIESIAAKLAPLLHLPAAEIARKFKQGGRFPVLKRGLTYEASAALTQARIEGIGITPAQERVYPNGSLARSILGQVSADGKGIAGLELTLDRRLMGKARRFKVIRDGKGHTIHRSVEEDEPARADCADDRPQHSFIAKKLSRRRRSSSRQREWSARIRPPGDARHGRLSGQSVEKPSGPGHLRAWLHL